MTAHLTSPCPAPSLTEVVDTRRGAVHAYGHLTVQGADLLCGTVESLHRSGHQTVVLDLLGVEETDAAGLALLEELRARLADADGELVVLAALDSTSRR